MKIVKKQEKFLNFLKNPLLITLWPHIIIFYQGYKGEL